MHKLLVRISTPLSLINMDRHTHTDLCHKAGWSECVSHCQSRETSQCTSLRGNNCWLTSSYICDKWNTFLSKCSYWLKGIKHFRFWPSYWIVLTFSCLQSFLSFHVFAIFFPNKNFLWPWKLCFIFPSCLYTALSSLTSDGFLSGSKFFSVFSLRWYKILPSWLKVPVSWGRLLVRKI